MKTKKFSKLIALFLALVMVMGLCACGGNNSASDGNNAKMEENIGTTDIQISEKDDKTDGDTSEAPITRIITDMLGREVEIPTEINTIICNGSNALRMVSYLQATDMMVGVEETDKGYETSTKRDYAHA